MLNLVQLQERLKDVPMQALMQYANGANPQIPPFLALGELNRRKKMQESAAAEQAKEMAGAPSIKEQIEQATGLMALQGSRQRQASQQQASASANQLMPAPNTMTSEPAQMASGGSVDDVMPRDYQAGGQISPDLAKRLMMLKAMKDRQGLSRLPMKNNMFKRADYAGGGIVAFSNGGSTFEGFETPQELPAQPKPTKQQLEEMTLAELQQYYRTGVLPERVRSPGLTDKQQSLVEDARDKGMAEILSRRRESAPPVARETREVREAPRAAAPAPAARRTGLASLDIEKTFPIPADFDEQKQLQKQQERKKLYGVSDQYLADAEADLAKRITAQQARREGQGMEQMIEFLSGIAEGRGGTFGTQGARGARASAKLRAAQQEANERQDEANAALRLALTEKRQALARGDMGAAEAAEKDIRKAQEDARKAQFDAYKSVEDLGIRRQQVAAMMRDPVEIQLYNLWASQQKPGADRSFEAFLRSKTTSDESLMLKRKQDIDKELAGDLNYQMLKISPKPEDQRKAEQMKMKRYAEAGISMPGVSSSTGGNRIRFDAQGNPIQ